MWIVVKQKAISGKEKEKGDKDFTWFRHKDLRPQGKMMRTVLRQKASNCYISTIFSIILQYAQCRVYILGNLKLGLHTNTQAYTRFGPHGPISLTRIMCGFCEIIMGLIKLLFLVVVGGETVGQLVLLVFDKNITMGNTVWVLLVL